MINWQVTAITINCSAIAEEVTIIVKNDWSVKCTGYDNLAVSRRARLELVHRSLNMKRVLDCKGTQCPDVTAYIQKLRSEESPKANQVRENK